MYVCEHTHWYGKRFRRKIFVLKRINPHSNNRPCAAHCLFVDDVEYIDANIMIIFIIYHYICYYNKCNDIYCENNSRVQ